MEAALSMEVIHWLGPLGRCVGTSYHASFIVVVLFVLAAFWELLIVNNDVHYIILS